MIWPQYPEGPLTEQTYHKVTRYRQGVVINFRSVRSKIYSFDTVFLINALCNALVIMGIAPLVVRIVALYLIPFGVSKSISEQVRQTISEDGITLDEDEEKGNASDTPAQPSQAPPEQAAVQSGTTPTIGIPGWQQSVMQPPIQPPEINFQLQRQRTQVLRASCIKCKGAFGVKQGMAMVRCPHCGTTQALQFM